MNSFCNTNELKSSKKKVLVFPCGSEIGLEINRALAYSTYFELWGLSSVSSNHGHFVYKNYLEGVPFVDDDNFIQYINKIIKENNIDFIIPAHDSVVLKLAQNIDKLSCKVITSPVKTCIICRSKQKTYNHFKNLLKIPMIFSQNNVLKYPVFVKPDIGQGSKGAQKVNSNKELDFLLSQNNELIILEYLPGKEYTIDCFTNNKGELLFSQGRERISTSNGISMHSKPVDNQKFQEIAHLINANLTFQGAWFFQLKEDKYSKLTLLEIAPRIAGAMGLYRSTGVNFVLLSIFDALGLNVRITHNSQMIEMDRALINRFNIHFHYENVYIDLDDTIICQDKINHFVIAFLYQCLNNNKKIHLITRHKYDIEATLVKYKINKDVFNSIIYVDKDKSKAEFIINNINSILIDDSFAEREAVSAKLNIPVFDISSIEALMDWRV